MTLEIADPAPASRSTATTETPLEAARRLSPEIIARAAEFETARRPPADFARTMAQAGPFRLTLPRELGGFELHLARAVFPVTGFCATTQVY
jgi:alkylation response protein AidB-like acyl-CoA dehydrogenase